MIKLNHVDKYFFKNKRNEIHVINNISLEFPDHGLVVLLGPSGSGKTTLLNVIGGLDKVQSGAIEFDDRIISHYQSGVWDDIRNEKVGYIFQNYNLLPNLSVYDNVAFVLKLLGITDHEKIDESVTYILKAVGMYKFRKKRATQLSGGQQQRVAIARALVKNPEIVIADEPTGNLDSRNTLDVMKIIKEISKDKLVVLVTHERDIASIYGDRIIELKDGEIISDEENSNDFGYEHIDENIVYLKDMHEIINHEEEQFELKMYHDQEKEAEPVKVRLIVRNKTLYLDVDSSFTKVKLLDNHSNLIIKDEHYKKLEQEEMIATTFDNEQLNLEHVAHQKRLIVSIKQTIRLAFQKVLSSTRKGKLLLVSFIFSGAMIALAMALVSNFIVPNSGYMKYDNHYVLFGSTDTLYYDGNYASDMPTYNELQATLEDGEFVNLLSSTTFSFVDKQTDSTFFSFTASVDTTANMEDLKLLYGNLPTTDSEIVITSTLADSFFETTLYGSTDNLAQNYGIWSYEDLLKEKLSKGGQEYSISGIVKSDLALIFISQNVYNSLLETSSYVELDNATYVNVDFSLFDLTQSD